MEKTTLETLGISKDMLAGKTPEQIHDIIKSKLSPIFKDLLEQYFEILSKGDKEPAIEKRDIMEELQQASRNFIEYIILYEGLVEEYNLEETELNEQESEYDKLINREKNAYQILGVSDKEELTDNKVADKAIKNIRMVTQGDQRNDFKQLMSRLILIQKKINAFSKLKDDQSRKDYKLQRSINAILRDAETENANISRIVGEKFSNPKCIEWQEDNETVRLTEEKRILDVEITHVEDAINTYRLERTDNSDKAPKSRYRARVYSNLNLDLMREDPDYFEAVRGLLTRGHVRLAKENLSGYVGDVVLLRESELTEYIIQYNPKYVAMCQRAEEIIASQNKKKTTEAQSKNEPEDVEESLE